MNTANAVHPGLASANDIHVEWRAAPDSWFITRRGQATGTGSGYRYQNQAVAFARAIAFSHRVEMVVHDRNGDITRYARASLTYPRSLD